MGHTQGCTSPGKVTCDPPVGSESERKSHPHCFQVQALKWKSLPFEEFWHHLHSQYSEIEPLRMPVSSFPSRPCGGRACVPAVRTEALNQVLVTWSPCILGIPGWDTVNKLCVCVCVCVCVCTFFLGENPSFYHILKEAVTPKINFGGWRDDRPLLTELLHGMFHGVSKATPEK